MKIHPVIWWLIALSILSGGGYYVYSKIRGIRNNNPGNLERTNDQWRGLSDDQSDERFFVFTHVRYGIRALGQVLTNYYRRHGLDTVEGIINRWAPPVENDTSSYVNSVAKRLDVEPGETINVEQVLPDLVRAIIRHENGVQPYSDEAIADGLSLMFS